MGVERKGGREERKGGRKVATICSDMGIMCEITPRLLH